MSTNGFILASASKARASVLRGAGIEPLITVPDVDEDLVPTQLRRSGTVTPAQEVAALANAKAEAALAQWDVPWPQDWDSALLVACDSMLEVDGTMEGKPHSPEVARERIRKMQGGDAVLWTGHAAVLLAPPSAPGRIPAVTGSAAGEESTTIHFSAMSDAEIDAYVATGEPLEVAGSFTLDGLGGAFISGIDGDPHSVIGISLPLVRRLATELGVFWPDFWNIPA